MLSKTLKYFDKESLSPESISEKYRKFKINLFKKRYKKTVTPDMIRINFISSLGNATLDMQFFNKLVIKKLNSVMQKFLTNVATTTNVFEFDVRITFSTLKDSKLANQEFTFFFDIPLTHYQSGNFLFKLADGSFTNLLFKYKPNENAINKREDLERIFNKYIKIMNKISANDIYLHIYSGIYFPDDFLKIRNYSSENNQSLLSSDSRKMEREVCSYYKYLHDENFITKDFIFNKVLTLNFIIYKDVTWTLSHFDYRKGVFDNFNTYSLDYNKPWELLNEFARCKCVDPVALEQEVTEDNYDEVIEVMKTLAY